MTLLHSAMRAMNGAAGRNAPPRLRALIMLSGLLRSKGLLGAADRSPLDLPVAAEQALWHCWRDAVADLQRAGWQAPVVRVLSDRETPAPASVSQTEGLDVRVDRDPADYRGTGGVLRDLAGSYDEQDYVLVSNAAQLLVEPMGRLVADLAATGGDVAVVSHEDGTPSGLMLVRCGCLDCIPAVGFVDMKEQALPVIAKSHRVEVIQRRGPAALTIRTLPDYISAVRWWHHRHEGRARAEDPFAEDWCPSFGIVEAGAEVSAGAKVYDSVVMRGARVESGAVAVRCVVCPGGVIRRGATMVDQLVTGSSRG